MARYSAVFVLAMDEQNRELRSPYDGELNLLSPGAVENFWDALYFVIQPFLCFRWRNLAES